MKRKILSFLITLLGFSITCVSVDQTRNFQKTNAKQYGEYSLTINKLDVTNSSGNANYNTSSGNIVSFAYNDCVENNEGAFTMYSPSNAYSRFYNTTKITGIRSILVIYETSTFYPGDGLYVSFGYENGTERQYNDILTSGEEYTCRSFYPSYFEIATFDSGKYTIDKIVIKYTCIDPFEYEEGTPGLTYTLSSDGTYYEVTSYPESVENVVIPYFYNNLPVRRIDASVFGTYTTDTSSYNKTLKTVKLPESITYLSIGQFYNCSALTSVNIPTGIKTISERLFYNCTSLKTITLPEGVEKIHTSSFYKTNLNYIIIPSTVNLISSSAFAKATISEIFLPKTITTIGYNAFSNAKITNMYLEPSSRPSGWQKDDEDSWNGGKAENLLWGCTKVEVGDFEFVISGTKFYPCIYKGTKTKVTLPTSFVYNGKTYIPSSTADNMFCLNKTIEEVIIPSNYLTINSNTFFNCTQLKKIELSAGLTEIQTRSFCFLKNITLFIPKSVSVVESNAFYQSNIKLNIESETIPSTWNQYWNYNFIGTYELGCSK